MLYLIYKITEKNIFFLCDNHEKNLLGNKAISLLFLCIVFSLSHITCTVIDVEFYMETEYNLRNAYTNQNYRIV